MSTGAYLIRVSEHEHPLVSKAAGGYSCDLCRSSDGERWRCSVRCDWDACGNCARKNLQAEIPDALLTQLHEHEVVWQDSLGYSCDECRSSDNRRYQCARCNYDLCGECFDKQLARVASGAAPPAALPELVMVPDHDHALKKDGRGGFSCDMCRGGAGERFTCSDGCNWDACEECVRSKGQPVGQGAGVAAAAPLPETIRIADHAHTLSQSSGGFRCDLCGGGSGLRYRCTDGCDWDACEACARSRGATAPVAAAAPALAALPPLIKIPDHEHNLQHASGSFMCDLCRGGEGQRFQCAEGCNWDACEGCARERGATAPAAVAVAEASFAPLPEVIKISDHEHNLKQEGGSFMCDLCRGGEGQRFKCAEGCNWDACESCARASGATAPGAAPAAAADTSPLPAVVRIADHEHALKQEDGGFMCDLCRGGEGQRYKCADGCNWDACESCVRSRGGTADVQDGKPVAAGASASLPQLIRIAAHSHPLKQQTGGFSCDLCRGGEGQRFQCSEGCNWDACAGCVVAAGMQALSISAAAAPVSAAAPPVAPVAAVAPAAPAAPPKPPATEGSIGQHGHLLKLERGGGFGCDLCGNGDQERRYACSEGCNYDVCGNCFDTYSVNGPMEPLLVDDGWRGPRLDLHSIGVAFEPCRNDAEGAARVANTIKNKRYSVLEDEVDYTCRILKRRIEELIKQIPTGEDFEFPRCFGRDEAEKLVGNISKMYSGLHQWLEAFYEEVGVHEAARATLIKVDEVLMLWNKSGVTVRNKLAVMRARAMHGRERDTEGSPLEYGLDYALKQLRNAAESNEGIGGRSEPIDQLRKVTRWLDALRQFAALFKAQLGYLSEAKSTLVLVDNAFKAAIPYYQRLVEAVGDDATPIEKAAGGPNLDGFVMKPAVAAPSPPEVGDVPSGAGMGAGAGSSEGETAAAVAVADGEVPLVRTPAEVYEELPPAIPVLPLDFSRHLPNTYLANLRIANAAAAELNSVSLLTARFLRTFSMDDPKAFKEATSSHNGDGGWRWSRFDSGDGITGCELMRKNLRKLREAIEEMEETQPNKGQPEDEVTILTMAANAYAACLTPCVAKWEQQWKDAVEGSKSSGMMDVLEHAYKSAQSYSNVQYGHGCSIAGKRYDHEAAFLAVIRGCTKALAAMNSGKVRARQVDEWKARLEEIIPEAKAKHIALCMDYGTRKPAEGNEPDGRYLTALNDYPEERAALKAAQAAALAKYKAEAEARRAAEAARRERIRQERIRKAVALAAQVRDPFTGGTVHSDQGEWKYSVEGSEHVLLCVSGQFKGSKHIWAPNEAYGTVQLSGDPANGSAVWTGESIEWQCPRDVGGHAWGYTNAEDKMKSVYRFQRDVGHPTAWVGGAAGWTAEANKAPSLIGNVRIDGSVPPVIAIIVAMYGAGLARVADRREEIRLEAERAEKARRAITVATGSGGGRRVPPPSRLYGKIKIVDSFPDVTVTVTNSFADIRVQIVDCFADSPGKWQIVDSFPDFTVQIVHSFADYKISYVSCFPGVN